MSVDFYGIEIIGILRVPRGDGKTKVAYELWLSNDLSHPDLPGALKDLSYLQEVTVQIGLSLNSKVSVTLVPPLEQGLEIINSELINWAGSELEVQVGYSTGTQALTQPFGGLVLKPDIRIGQDVQITLNCLGVAYGMNLSNATSQRTYSQGTTPADAVLSTLQSHDVDVSDLHAVFPDFSPEEIGQPSRDGTATKAPGTHPFFKPILQQVETGQDSKGSSIFNTVPSAIDKGVKNDWWFVREMCQNYHLDLIIRDHTVTIKDPEKWKAGEPKFTFVLKGPIDSEKNRYPILEFNTPSSFVWLSQGVGGAVIADVSTTTKQAIQNEYTTANDPNAAKRSVFDSQGEVKSEDASTGSKQGASSALSGKRGLNAKTQQVVVPVVRTGEGAYNSTGGTMDAYQMFPGSPEDQRAEMVLNELRNYNQTRGIQVEINTLGIPTLLPGDVIRVEGFADSNGKSWFDGNYGVMTVEHTIGTGGMSTKFKGLRNAFFPEMQVGISGAGHVNDTPAPSVDQLVNDFITTIAKTGP